MKIIILTAIILVSSPLLADGCDTLPNGYELVPNPDYSGGLRITGCIGSIHRQFLVQAIDKFKDDSTFIKALKQIEVGSDFKSIREAVDNYSGELALDGEKQDRTALEYILAKLNSIVEQENVDSKKRQADRLKTQLTPLKVGLSDFSNMAESNQSTSDSIIRSDCSKGSALENKMKSVRVNFADGEATIFTPLNSKKLGPNETEFEVLVNADDIKKSTQAAYRTVRVVDGKFVWVSSDGKQYPIDHFSEVKTDEEAIGMNMGLNNAQNSICRYRKFLIEQKSLTNFTFSK